MSPTCPQDYSCTFTKVHPRVIYHTVGPWYQHTAGWIVAITAILVIGSLLAYIAVQWLDLRDRRESASQAERQRELERAHELAIEEQRTMQADMAKGDPEMLKLIRQR